MLLTARTLRLRPLLPVLMCCVWPESLYAERDSNSVLTLQFNHGGHLAVRRDGHSSKSHDASSAEAGGGRPLTHLASTQQYLDKWGKNVTDWNGVVQGHLQDKALHAIEQSDIYTKGLKKPKEAGDELQQLVKGFRTATIDMHKKESDKIKDQLGKTPGMEGTESTGSATYYRMNIPASFPVPRVGAPRHINAADRANFVAKGAEELQMENHDLRLQLEATKAELAVRANMNTGGSEPIAEGEDRGQTIQMPRPAGWTLDRPQPAWTPSFPQRQQLQQGFQEQANVGQSAGMPRSGQFGQSGGMPPNDQFGQSAGMPLNGQFGQSGGMPQGGQLGQSPGMPTSQTANNLGGASSMPPNPGGMQTNGGNADPFGDALSDSGNAVPFGDALSDS